MPDRSPTPPTPTPPKPVPPNAAEADHFFSAAKAVALLTLLSRVLGLVRDMVIIPLGGDVLADRFWTAFSVPNLFRRLFGEGALSAAFVPVFTDVVESTGRDRARAVLANVAGLLALLLSVLTLLIWLGLWGAWELFGGDFARLFLLRMTALMLPFMVTVCLLALASAALQCSGRFAYPAFAPVLLNLGLIAGALWAAPTLAETDAGQFTVVGISLLVAGSAQLLGAVWLLGRTGLLALRRLRPVLPEVKRIARHMAPMVIPLSVLQFSAFADRLIALIFTTGDSAPLAPGVVRCLYAANRLFQLPLGVLAISVATVVFPLFSRFAARGETAGLRDSVNRALRLCLFLAAPSAVALMLLSGPLIALLFERGRFNPADTARTVAILRMYCLGMAAYFCNHVLLRAFFAVGQTRRPLVLACCLVGLNLLLVLIGIHTPLGGSAIGLATAVTSTINAALLVADLRRRWGRIGLGRILRSLLGVTLATGLLAGAMAAVLHFGPGLLSRWVGWAETSSPGRVAVIAAAVLAGTAAYLLTARLARMDELADVLRRPPPAHS